LSSIEISLAFISCIVVSNRTLNQMTKTTFPKKCHGLIFHIYFLFKVFLVYFKIMHFL